jgi:hypothetical protein
MVTHCIWDYFYVTRCKQMEYCLDPYAQVIEPIPSHVRGSDCKNLAIQRFSAIDKQHRVSLQ